MSRQTTGRLGLLLTVLTAIPLATAPAARAQDASAETIVDALNTIFGKQKARASHAKGQCVTGTFTPAPEAPGLSKSPSFAKAVPVLARFSMGGGNPKIPDATKAAVRAIAFKLDPDGKSSEFAFVNAPVQFAKSPAQMLGFLQARFPGADGKPDPAKIKAFSDANPETTNQGKWLAGKPVPASYAGVNYWGVHAYTLTNAKGDKAVVKFKLIPTAGEAGLTDDEAKAKPADFLIDELKGRLEKGAASFDLIAIIGEAGDQTNDPSAMWPEDKRKTVKLGTMAIAAIADNAKCDAGTFDPTQLADGISGPKDDPLFDIRSPAYAVSLSRRAQ
ncbi:MAG: catalase family peroxidase [Hyphomicrobium sp.]